MQEMTHRDSKELRIFMNEHHDNCSLCGRPFSEGDTAYLGYRKDNSCALLCDKCSDELKETVDRYYWMKREYEVPRPSDVLWRYMDLSKLIYLIAKRALYFPSAECFPDNFEGAKVSLDRKSQWDGFYLNFLKKPFRPHQDSLHNLTTKVILHKKPRDYLTNCMIWGHNLEKIHILVVGI